MKLKLSKIIYQCFMKINNIVHLILTENSDVWLVTSVDSDY